MSYLVHKGQLKKNESINTKQHVNKMLNLTDGKPLSMYSDEWEYLEQNVVDRNEGLKEFSTQPDELSVFIPMGIYLYETSGVEIEGPDGYGVDFQFEFEMNPQRDHSQYMVVKPYYIDKYPVTMYNYSNYLKESNYKPSMLNLYDI